MPRSTRVQQRSDAREQAAVPVSAVSRDVTPSSDGYDGFVLQNSGNANKIYTRACTICHQMVHGSTAIRQGAGALGKGGV